MVVKQFDNQTNVPNIHVSKPSLQPHPECGELRFLVTSFNLSHSTLPNRWIHNRTLWDYKHQQMTFTVCCQVRSIENIEVEIVIYTYPLMFGVSFSFQSNVLRSSKLYIHLFIQFTHQVQWYCCRTCSQLALWRFYFIHHVYKYRCPVDASDFVNLLPRKKLLGVLELLIKRVAQWKVWGFKKK